MISFFVARSILKQGGLGNNDYFSDFAINPPNAVKSVYFKQGEAAGGGDIVIAMPVVSPAIDTSQIKTLVLSSKLPHLPWAIKAPLPLDVKNRIVKAFLELNNHEQGKSVLKTAKLSGIHKASDPDYDIHRKIIKEVLGEEY